ncbi:MAG: class I SAM-dependent methyltransferase [Candidatus Roizmanbacteria bacterium]
MKMENTIPSNRAAVLGYYARAEEGYWNDLGGVCHYGFSNEGDKGPFDMVSAQVEMERLLGKTLDLPAGSQVLDAGCGYGPIARTLSNEFNHNVTGIDLIARRLQRNLEINERVGPSQIDLVNADYHRLPFADGSFDGICTMETLVHAHNHQLVLSEFLRVLKPGGKVVLFEYTIPELDSIPKLARNLAERVIRNTGMTSLPHFTHGSMGRILENAGFQQAQSKDISKNVHASWHHMWKLAVRSTLVEFSHGTIGLDTIPGSAWIWPARSNLGYSISRASKPDE